MSARNGKDEATGHDADNRAKRSRIWYDTSIDPDDNKALGVPHTYTPCHQTGDVNGRAIDILLEYVHM